LFQFKLFNFLLIPLVFCYSCTSDLKKYINDQRDPIKIYLEPTEMDIEILFLRSISSKTAEGDEKKILIQKLSQQNANWFRTRLRSTLLKNGISVVDRDRANVIFKTKIVDMGEVRPKMFIEGLSIGLVLGLIAGEVTGNPEVGLAVFVWEVIEEFIILYVLKSYFMVTTIELTAEDLDGNVLLSKEFTAYSNDDFIKKLPEFSKNLRENKVRASLDQNAGDITEFIYKIKHKL